MKSRIAIVLCIALLIGCMPVSAVPAAVTPYYGDVNRDGSSDAADALLVLQNSVGLAGLTLDQQARADVNMDIKIDAADALLILQRSVELITAFLAEEEAISMNFNPYTNQTAYAQSVPGVTIDGPVTTFQTGISYMPSVHIPSGAVMPYVENVGGYAERVASWAEGFEGRALFIMMNSQLYPEEYFTQYGGSEDEIQIDQNGNVLRFADWETSMWLVPTRNLSEYCFKVIESYCDEYPVEAVIMEEPDFMRAAGYSKAFRDAWKEYYEEDWVDPASSPDALYRASRLKVHMFEEHFEWVGSKIQEKYGDRVRLIVATHSVPAYNVFPIVAGDAHYAALEHVDGIIGQTWSNTMKVPVAYGGGMQQRLFESGYIGYASFPDMMRPDQWLFTLTDPYEDFGGDDWDFYRDCYAQQVVAQLMQQDIHRFQETIWVSRSFSADVPIDYRTMQLGVFQAMNEIPGQASTLYAGTPGISMALSDSLAWQYGAQYQPTESTANGFYGVTIPLVERGIPLSITSLDQLSSVDDLKDVRLLLVSYDIMKPMREEINEILAQWVKEGGVLLSLGGHDAFEEIDGAWWGRNPLQNLIQHLGAGLQVGRLNDPSSGFSWTGDESHGQNLISLALDPTYGSYAATFFGAGYETILEASGQSIGIDCPVGKGRLIAVGLPSSYYSSHSSGPDMVRSLVEYATQYTGYRYVESNLMSVKRGNVVASHAMLMSETLEGNFINLLDASLPVVHSVEVAAGASSLLYDISNAMTEGTPRLAFTSGTLDGEVTETAGRTTLRLSGPEMTPVTARILGNGRTPSKVRVTLDGKDYRLSDYGWDNTTGSLLLSVLTGPDQPVDIEIEWGDAPVADRVPAQYASLTILTNEAGEDADYLVRNSGASANASIRYCDGAAELVYRFDLDEFDDAMFSCEVINNYVLSISDHDGDYQTIFDYSQISDERAESNNLAFLNFAPADYGLEDGPLYIRLSNTDPTKGHGGAIYSISIQYKK